MTRDSAKMSDQNAIFEEQLKAWFYTLSPEDRSIALSVKDGAFLSTLIHFGALSTSSLDDGKAEIDGQGAKQVDRVVSKCNWSKEFLLDDIEKIYNTYCERFGMSSESTLAVNIAMRQPSTLSSEPSDESTVDVIESKPLQVAILSDNGEGFEKVTTSSDVVADDDDSDIIQGSQIESDAIRIQSCEKVESTVEATNAKILDDILTNEKAILKHQSQTTSPISLLSEIQLIFPSVAQAAKEHGLQESLDFSQVDGDSSPILTLPPSALKNDVYPPDAHLKCGPDWEAATWLTKLREHVKNTSNVNEQSASLSLMMLSRIHVSAKEAFVVGKRDETDQNETKEVVVTAKNGDDGEEEQSSIEQYTTTPPEEEGSDANNEMEDIELAALSLVDQLPSNRVPHKPRKLQIAETVKSEPEPTKVLGISEVVKKFVQDSDLEEFSSHYVRESPLPFVCFETVVGYDDAEMCELDASLKKFLGSVLARADEAGVLQTNSPKAIDKEVKCLAVDEEQEKTASPVAVQHSQHAFAFGKKKKKKKKRKRKISNADSMGGKEVPAPEPVKSLAAMAAATALPETPNPSPRNIKQVSTESFTQQVPQLSAADSFDSDQTGQSSKESSSAEAAVSVLLIPNNTDESSIRGLQTKSVEPSRSVVRSSVSLQNKPVREEQPTAPATPQKANDEGDVWETVEAKGRNKSRNKASDSRSYSSQYSNSNSRKVKSGRTAASRRRTTNRKMVRDILSSVLDSVEVEVRKRRRAADAKSFEDRRRRSVQPRSLGGGQNKFQASLAAKQMSLRDVVLRKPTMSPKKASDARRHHPSSKAKRRNPSAYAGIVRAALNDVSKKDKVTEPQTKGTQTQTARADQGTAQTIPETLSGTSGNTQASLATEEVDNISDKVGRQESAAATLVDGAGLAVDKSDEEEPNRAKIVVSTDKESSPAPPLPTLLGPGNTNSATSSVASSLEAPHASNHRHHHHSSSCNENDVGYHLLDVCDRLSRDMNVFMMRRSVALTARRRERGALLVALQDTVTNIWAGHGNVEMYGSCATQLDLPSSDIDAVILGLDAFPAFQIDPGVISSKSSTKKQHHLRESSGSIDSIPSSPNTPNSPYNMQNMGLSPYGRQSSNGERVMLLAAELERQPWAVQVKAIPTASVPVVKILADPSKLPGAVSSCGPDGDWMLQQHHMAAQAAAAAVGAKPPPSPSVQTGPVTAPPLAQGQPAYSPHTPPPWRGADVMNGLFSLDITFEGPEHGGLGSTKYSADVVQEACTETGLPPEGTPVVQVLMVLKELLAQRRLNEPFSGGLSSYALLLLVNAVVKERAIIGEEMKRIERHREFVAAENTAIVAANFEKATAAPSKEAGKTGKGADPSMKRKPLMKAFANQRSARTDSTKRADTNNVGDGTRKTAKPMPESQTSSKQPSGPKVGSPPVRVSSWACIAKNSGQKTPAAPQSAGPKSTAKAQQKAQPPKATSFAEAVSRKQQAPAKQHFQKQRGQTTRKDQDGRQSKRVDNNKLEKKAEPKSSSGNAQMPSKLRAKERPPSQPVAAVKTTQEKVTATSKNEQSNSFKQNAKQGMVQHTKANSFVPLDSSLSGASSLFPQGSNDVLEVLCSGETSAGKLLMHFLLYYGEHFDSRTNAIDVVGSCNPNRPIGANPGSFHLSPYIPRNTGGTIDPITGMLTVDPIVVYDPWEGGIGNNVARSCYAWSSIRWHFAQCYMTLSSAVERSGTPPAAPAHVAETTKVTPAFASTAPRKEAVGDNGANIAGNTHTTNKITSDAARTPNKAGSNTTANVKSNTSDPPQPVDTVSPLLELLLSF